jgi:thiol-disulfide isomerase/thioredoxin
MPLIAPDGPVLDVYYASTCAPCRAELGALAEVVREGHDTLIIHFLTDATIARDELAAASPSLLERAVALPAGTDQRAVLRDAGDADGILPFSRVRMGDGRACAKWRGILTVTRIKALLRAC